MSVPSEWYARSECTPRCRSKTCVTDLNKLITKCNLHQLREYLLDNCPSSVLRADLYGRTPVHLAASVGQVQILSWLLETFHCDIDTKDAESAWTPLHRAVYYGRLSCATLLIEHGADMSLRDKDGMTSLDIATLDSSPWVKHLQHSRLSYEMPCDFNAGDRSELYTWGINDNFTLAQGNPKGSKFPEIVEFFVKRRIGIKQVAMSKFHSVFVAVSGSIYSCGHGEGGRLGTGHQQSSLEPQQMVLPAGTGIRVAAVGANHTVLVTDCGKLLTSGLNKYRVLGLNNQPDRILVPTRILGSLKDQQIVDCAAGMFHTVVLTRNGAIFTFGTNAGQLGHAKGNVFVVQPRQVSGVYKEDDPITCIHACDSATLLATKQGTVYLLQNYICRKIMTKQLNIEKVQVGGGRLDTGLLSQVDQRLASIHSQLKEEYLNILVQKKSGDLIAWSKEHNRIDRCNFSVKLSLLFKDITLCNYGHTALLITNTGIAYIAKYGNWRAPKRNRKLSTSCSSNSFNSCLDMLDADSVQEFILDQQSCIFRAHTGTLGPKAKGGAVLQCEPRNFLTEIPSVSESILSTDMKKLLENVSENDSIHDLVIIATNSHGQRLAAFPCHQYVLSTRSEFFKKLLHKRKSDDVGVKEAHDKWHVHSSKVYHLLFQNCDPNVLHSVLEFAYSETCQIFSGEVKIPALEEGTDSSGVNITWEGAEGNNNGMVIEGDSDVVITECKSAFEIYQQNKDSKISKNKRNKKGKKSAKGGNRNFIAEVKALAKKVGLPSTNLFDLVTVDNGIVKVKESKSTNSLSFHPQKCIELIDIELECNDGVILGAHKCILVARIEFFRSMLLSSWAETKGVSVKVPIPSDVFKHILDFVYTASVSRLDTILSVELLCEIMAAADQLLLDRLKEATEVQVASLLTLKNVASVIELASIFNCVQLKSTCEQFVCHHLPALLHTPNFFSLDYEALNKLQIAYRASILGMSNRIIPPSSEAPDISYIEPEEPNRSDEDGFSSSFERPYIDELMSSPPKRKHFFGKQRNKKKSSLSKSITQGITLSELLTQKQCSKVCGIVGSKTPSPTTDDMMNNHLENEGTDKSQMEREDTFSFSPINKNDEKVPLVGASGQSLLTSKSCVSSQPDMPFVGILETEETNGQFCHWAKKGGNVNSNNHRTNEAEMFGPTLAENSKVEVSDSGRPTQHTVFKPFKKASQKQRKRLQQEATGQKDPDGAEENSQHVILNAWGNVGSPPVEKPRSFWSVMTEQSEKSKGPDPTIAVKKTPLAVSPTKTAPDGPWQQIPSHTTEKSDENAKQNASASLRDIIRSEIHSVTKLQKQQSKPMHLIQLEDRAMAEIKACYEKNSPVIDKQYFTVERM